MPQYSSYGTQFYYNYADGNTTDLSMNPLASPISTLSAASLLSPSVHVLNSNALNSGLSASETSVTAFSPQFVSLISQTRALDSVLVLGKCV